MRNYIEEELDFQFNEIKEYVLKLKDYTIGALYNEIIHNIQTTFSDRPYVFEEDWINGIKENYANENFVGLIARAIEEKYYIFDDDEEHNWNKEVISNIIKNLPVINRRSNEEYK